MGQLREGFKFIWAILPFGCFFFFFFFSFFLFLLRLFRGPFLSIKRTLYSLIQAFQGREGVEGGSYPSPLMAQITTSTPPLQWKFTELYPSNIHRYWIIPSRPRGGMNG